MGNRETPTAPSVAPVSETSAGRPGPARTRATSGVVAILVALAVGALWYLLAAHAAEGWNRPDLLFILTVAVAIGFGASMSVERGFVMSTVLAAAAIVGRTLGDGDVIGTAFGGDSSRDPAEVMSFWLVAVLGTAIFVLAFWLVGVTSMTLWHGSVGRVARQVLLRGQRWMSGRGVALWLVVLITLTGCSGLGSDHAVGWAKVRFDDVTLGAGGDSYPRVNCRRWDDRTNPSEIVNLDRSSGGAPSNWRPGGDGPKATLSLEFPARFLSGWEVRVRFSIGSSVYEKDYEHGSDVLVTLRWKDGRAVLTDIPLVRGDPYEGRSSLKRLVVEWHCQEPGSALAVPPPAK